MSRYICVFFSKAPAYRARGHTHWFVCQKCLRRIARGEPDWKPAADILNPQRSPMANEEKTIEHVDRLNSIEKLEAEGFMGQDASLAECIFEYGLAWKKIPEENCIVFIYQIHQHRRPHRFDRCSLKLDVDVAREWNWIDKHAVCEVTGLDEPQWDALPLEDKVADLLRHYGCENIFGTSYWEGFQIEQ